MFLFISRKTKQNMRHTKHSKFHKSNAVDLSSLSVAAIGAFLIYISSDYVFDGTNPPYTEEDIPSPLNLYGKTKLDGEKAVLENNLGKIQGP
jgi:dTDP-4-dehydrorhamnose reductase